MEHVHCVHLCEFMEHCAYIIIKVGLGSKFFTASPNLVVLKYQGPSIYFKLFVPRTILEGSKFFIASPVSFMHVHTYVYVCITAFLHCSDIHVRT